MTDKQNNVMNIENLSVKVGDKNILKSLNLTIKSGEIHALMGPNGAGKSTLAQAIIGNPKYTVTTGKILINGKDITDLQLYERARRDISCIPGTGIRSRIEIYKFPENSLYVTSSQ